jgi:hypothetical protein
MSDEVHDEPTPAIAGWIALSAALGALGCVLWFVALHEWEVLLDFGPKDDPLLLAAMSCGIVGILAGIVGLVRAEPKRVVVTALVISALAVLAKFVFAAMVIGFVVVLALALISQMG